MNCYDCNSLGLTSPALAVCHDCGAGVCAEHTMEAFHHLTRIFSVNLEVRVEPPQRRIRCQTCAAAVTARSRPADLRAARKTRRLAEPRRR